MSHRTHIKGMLRIRTVQAPMNFYGSNLFSDKELNHHSRLHTCAYKISHFERPVPCAHVTDPSATHS
jgi:hypothetical protein